ncbi:MAG: hypothetical protein OXH49_12150 [Gemmatimonadetes bacterium]|nr:hypothetical protein [Gemmatimonadota bacterium]
MIAGLPLGTWVLMVLSTLPGLVLVVAAYRVHAGADRGQQRGGPRGPEAPQAHRDRSPDRG